MILLPSADYLSKLFFFSKKSFINTFRVLNSLGPDLGPNYLRRLSADDKTVAADKTRVKLNVTQEGGYTSTKSASTRKFVTYFIFVKPFHSCVVGYMPDFRHKPPSTFLPFVCK